MNLALLGYGKMGKLIEQLAPEYGAAVVLKLDEFNNANFEGITAANFAGVDVAIEFSIPAATVTNVRKVAALGVSLVVGTTGWLEHLQDVRKVVEDTGVGLVWSPNFSIGVNVFSRLVADAARMLSSHPGYGAWAWEIHHDTKKDAPSGTLLKLVDEMKRAGYARSIDMSSSRAGRHPGTHEIGFDSAADTITMRHVARNREGFAHGALAAAKWIRGKRGIYEFSETLFS